MLTVLGARNMERQVDVAGSTKADTCECYCCDEDED